MQPIVGLLNSLVHTTKFRSHRCRLINKKNVRVHTSSYSSVLYGLCLSSSCIKLATSISPYLINSTIIEISLGIGVRVEKLPNITHSHIIYIILLTFNAFVVTLTDITTFRSLSSSYAMFLFLLVVVAVLMMVMMVMFFSNC